MKIRINGVKYNIEFAGQGEPLLLLHGFTGSHENWKPFLHEWCTSHQMVMLDILGHGRSDCPREPSRYTIEQIVSDIKDILEEFKITKTHILGYSMGGRLAFAFAVKYLNHVSSLIVESSSPGIENRQERSKRVREDEALADFIIEKGMPAFVDYWEELPLFSSQKSLPDHIRDKIRNQRLDNDPLGIANSLRGMGSGRQPSLWDCLHSLQIPVYVIIGDKDEKFCRIAQKMSKKLPNAETIVVENAGHAVHVEKPEIYGKIVRGFLNQL